MNKKHLALNMEYPEKNKNQAQKIHPELEELKTRFLSIASHELKTPLTGILSSLNLIDRYLESDAANWNRFKHHEKVESHLKKIQESATNLSSILNKFLSIRNIERGEIPLKISQIDLKRALQRQTEQFQSVSKPGQVITYRHNTKKTRVNIDKYLLRNIINNLLSNAIKFSPPDSEINLTSSIDPKIIRLELKDQGIGIPVAEQKKIFREFYRADNAKISEEGTGLGLYIVQRYINLLGGSIEFKSQVNEGTTVIIVIPNNLTDEKNPGH